MSRTISSLFALTVLLAACGGPDTQEGSSTILDGDQNTQIAGVIIPQRPKGHNAAQVAAAKARVPLQYRESEPLSLFDFNTNLNPASDGVE